MAIDPNSKLNLYKNEISELYSDLDFSLSRNTAGNVVIVKNIDCISQSIKTILSTTPGERLMLPEFGSNLKEYVFEQLDSGTTELIISEVETALERWEDRIAVIDVAVEEDPDGNTIILTVEYSINATGEVDNFIGKIKT